MIIYKLCRLIRLSSPNLNYLMIAGMLFVYFSGIAYGIPKTDPPAALALCFVSVIFEVQWKVVSHAVLILHMHITKGSKLDVYNRLLLWNWNDCCQIVEGLSYIQVVHGIINLTPYSSFVYVCIY